MSPILRTLLDEFVVPAVSNVSLKIRDAAVKAIGCLTLRDPKAARKHLLLVIQVSFYVKRTSLGPIRVNFWFKYLPD
jgi:hypothetical protein